MDVLITSSPLSSTKILEKNINDVLVNPIGSNSDVGLSEVSPRCEYQAPKVPLA